MVGVYVGEVVIGCGVYVVLWVGCGLGCCG